jgi:hypothetical protein
MLFLRVLFSCDPGGSVENTIQQYRAKTFRRLMWIISPETSSALLKYKVCM